MRVKVVSIICVTLGIGLVAAVAASRDMLWRVVQACVLDHDALGSAFPCLFVDTSHGRDVGYAVLRAPTDEVKVVVTPTVRTIGIEDPRLRGSKAPNYFAAAWAARYWARDGLPHPPGDDDLALALNSRPGRSQDQLHIHVACLAPEAKRAIEREAANIYGKTWVRMKVLPRAPHYVAHFEPDLSRVNVIDLAAEGLKATPHEMDGVTIVAAAIAADPDHPAGFIILARRRMSARDEPHGEAFLDQDCDLAGIR